MNAIAINGSPRKKGNTAQLLEQGLAGFSQACADRAETTTELVHLYDLAYTGCTSCFACKRINGKSYGRCAVQDDLTPVLERILDADAILLGTPVYFWAESGMMRCFLERMLFPLYTYTPERTSLYAGKARLALLYTMNLPEKDVLDMGLDKQLAASQNFIRHVFGNLETLLIMNTLQFDDYSKYLSTRFDARAKKIHHDTHFPQELARVFELGERLARADR